MANIPDKSANSRAFESTIPSELACPACFGDLRLHDTHLVCTACRRAYPITDGIPVLIVERAEEFPG